MPPTITESDWKRFKEIHELARERFAERCLNHLQYHLSDTTVAASDRFFQTKEALLARAKQFATLFDEFRRSTALTQVVLMRAEKLISDEEMLRFSDDFRNSVASLLSYRTAP